jgi:5-methylcytosine-specific restriction endonuclease McrA
MCNTHNLRAERYGDPHFTKKAANGTLTGKTCVIDGCDLPQKARSLCSVHFSRARNHGDPLAPPKKLGNGQATEERKRENRARAMKAYAQTPYGKMRRRFNQAKRRILVGATTDRYIDKDEFLKLWNTKTCGICMSELDDRTKSIDHVIPLARGGDNTMANLQMAHLICNQRKNSTMVKSCSTL